MELHPAARAIVYAPDHLVNAGGTINVAYERGGYDEARAREHVGEIFETTRRLFEQARGSGKARSVLVDRAAEESMERARHVAGAGDAIRDVHDL